jgi:hypothetical protein
MKITNVSRTTCHICKQNQQNNCDKIPVTFQTILDLTKEGLPSSGETVEGSGDPNDLMHCTKYYDVD